MNKFYLLIIISLIVSNVIGQESEDRIITTDHDTIECKITFVNNHNIFYNYKKKRKTKSDFISRDLVYAFNKSKPENIKFDTIASSEKCDTCKNYIVLDPNDTIYYNLKMHPLTKDLRHIQQFSIVRPNTTINYFAYDIPSIQWNGREYSSIALSDNDLDKINYTFLFKLIQKKHLGLYIIKDKTSLLEFTYLVESNITYLLRYWRKEYLIEINNERIIIPRGDNAFIMTLKYYLKDDPELVLKIENRELVYEDLEEIIKIYNLND